MKLLMPATLILTACTTPAPETRHAPLHCPPVPACERPRQEIRTHADLAAALQHTRAALAVCTLARNTLQACIDNQTP